MNSIFRLKSKVFFAIRSYRSQKKTELIFLIFLTMTGQLISCANLPDAQQEGSQREKQEALSRPQDKPRRALVFAWRYNDGLGMDVPKNLFIDRTLVATLTRKSFTRVELAPGEHEFLIINEKEPPSDYFDQFSRKFSVKSGKTYVLKYNERVSVKTALSIEETVVSAMAEKAGKHKYFAPSKPYLSHQNVTQKDVNLWNSFQDKSSVTAMENFIAQHPDSPFVRQAQKRIDELKKEEFKKLVSLKSKNLESYYAFLKTNPSPETKAKVFEKMTTLIVERKNKKNEYLKLYNFDANSSKFFPEKVRMELTLMNIGPIELTVGKVREHLKNGVASRLLVSKIKATSAPYKNFSFKEISFLKTHDLNDDVIGAMIDVTTSFEERMKREQQNKELQATIQKAISQSKNSITDQEVAQDGGNTPVSCLKLKAALAGCDKLGGFMGSACKVTARSGSDCKMEL